MTEGEVVLMVREMERTGFGPKLSNTGTKALKYDEITYHGASFMDMGPVVEEALLGYTAMQSRIFFLKYFRWFANKIKLNPGELIPIEVNVINFKVGPVCGLMSVLNAISAHEYKASVIDDEHVALCAQLPKDKSRTYDNTVNRLENLVKFCLKRSLNLIVVAWKDRRRRYEMVYGDFGESSNLATIILCHKDNHWTFADTVVNKELGPIGDYATKEYIWIKHKEVSPIMLTGFGPRRANLNNRGVGSNSKVPRDIAPFPDQIKYYADDTCNRSETEQQIHYVRGLIQKAPTGDNLMEVKIGSDTMMLSRRGLCDLEKGLRIKNVNEKKIMKEKWQADRRQARSDQFTKEKDDVKKFLSAGSNLQSVPVSMRVTKAPSFTKSTPMRKVVSNEIVKSSFPARGADCVNLKGAGPEDNGDDNESDNSDNDDINSLTSSLAKKPPSFPSYSASKLRRMRRLARQNKITGHGGMGKHDAERKNEGYNVRRDRLYKLYGAKAAVGAVPNQDMTWSSVSIDHERVGRVPYNPDIFLPGEFEDCDLLGPPVCGLLHMYRAAGNDISVEDIMRVHVEAVVKSLTDYNSDVDYSDDEFAASEDEDEDDYAIELEESDDENSSSAGTVSSDSASALSSSSGGSVATDDDEDDDDFDLKEWMGLARYLPKKDRNAYIFGVNNYAKLKACSQTTVDILYGKAIQRKKRIEKILSRRRSKYDGLRVSTYEDDPNRVVGCVANLVGNSQYLCEQSKVIGVNLLILDSDGLINCGSFNNSGFRTVVLQHDGVNHWFLRIPRRASDTHIARIIHPGEGRVSLRSAVEFVNDLKEDLNFGIKGSIIQMASHYAIKPLDSCRKIVGSFLTGAFWGLSVVSLFVGNNGRSIKDLALCGVFNTLGSYRFKPRKGLLFASALVTGGAYWSGTKMNTMIPVLCGMYATGDSVLSLATNKTKFDALDIMDKLYFCQEVDWHIETQVLFNKTNSRVSSVINVEEQIKYQDKYQRITLTLSHPSFGCYRKSIVFSMTAIELYSREIMSGMILGVNENLSASMLRNGTANIDMNVMLNNVYIPSLVKLIGFERLGLANTSHYLEGANDFRADDRLKNVNRSHFSSCPKNLLGEGYVGMKDMKCYNSDPASVMIKNPETVLANQSDKSGNYVISVNKGVVIKPKEPSIVARCPIGPGTIGHRIMGPGLIPVTDEVTVLQAFMTRCMSTSVPNYECLDDFVSFSKRHIDWFLETCKFPLFAEEDCRVTYSRVYRDKISAAQIKADIEEYNRYCNGDMPVGRRRKYTRCSVFCKLEDNAKEVNGVMKSRPRLICQMSDKEKMECCRIVELYKVWYSGRVRDYSIKECSPEEFESRLTSVMRDRGHQVTDVSSWETSMRSGLRVLAEYLDNRLCEKADLPGLRRGLQSHHKNKIKYYSKHCVVNISSLGSGRFYTATFNYTINLMLYLYCISVGNKNRLLGIKNDDNKEMPLVPVANEEVKPFQRPNAVFEGDDGLAPLGTFVDAVYSDLGIDLKDKLIGHNEGQCDFLSVLFVNGRRYPNIVKVCNRLLWIMKGINLRRGKQLFLLRLKAYSAWLMYGDCPIIMALVVKIGEITRGIDSFGNWQRYVDHWKEDHLIVIKDFPRKVEVPSERRAVIQSGSIELPPIGVATQLKCEQMILDGDWSFFSLLHYYPMVNEYLSSERYIAEHCVGLDYEPPDLADNDTLKQIIGDLGGRVEIKARDVCSSP